MKILIPTYDRVSSQLTWDLLPGSVLENAWLLVRPAEVRYHESKGRQCLVCSAQWIGFGGIARVRKWIVEQYLGSDEKVLVLDDDISNILGSGMPLTRPGQFQEFVDHVSELLDHSARAVVYPHWVYTEPGLACLLQVPAQFCCYGFNFRELPKDVVGKIDFDLVQVLEDISVSYQFTMHGVDCIASSEYYVDPLSHSRGGLQSFRDRYETYDRKYAGDKLIAKWPDIFSWSEDCRWLNINTDLVRGYLNGER